MVNLRLVHYIEKELEKDFSRENITKVLVKNGYKEEEVQECFKYLDDKKEDKHVEVISSEKILDKVKPALPHKEKNFIMIVVGLVLIMLAAFVILKLFAADEGPQGVDEPLIEFEPEETGPPPLDTLNDEELFALYFDSCVLDYLEDADDVCISLALRDASNCLSEECRGDYFLYTAIAYNDKSRCQKIPDETLRQACHVKFDGDPSKCNFLEGDDRKYCEAWVSADSSLCQSLPGTLTEECTNDLRIYDAMISNDQEKCQLLSDPDMMSLCLAHITGDESFCADQDFCRDEANFAYAHVKRNATLCEPIVNQTFKQQCITAIETMIY